HCAVLTRRARRFCCGPRPERRVVCAISWSSLRTMSSGIGGGGAQPRHSSKREPTCKACVTTDVVASPVTMLANGHKAPLFQRPLQPDSLSLKEATGDGAPSYFPLSAITDRLYARNQL